MPCGLRFVLLLLVLVGFSGAASAQESLSVEQLRRLKAATVFIKTQAGREGATGSGFLIRVDNMVGYLVTNHHVIEQALGPLRVLNFPATKPGSKIEAVFESGSPNDRSLSAEILSVDPDKDLAVLRVKSDQPFPQPLDLQNVPQLRETLPVFLCGFPFGDSLSQAKNPEITISPGTVSAIRFTPTGQLREVQLTGSLNSGNSGGPVVTADGKLIGVARATIRGSGIGLAIPQQEVAAMLQGRIGSIRLLRLPDSPNYQLQIPLIDPLKQIESATLHVQAAVGKLPVLPPDSPAQLLPQAMAKPLTLAAGIAFAEVPPFPDTLDRFRVQVELKTKSGSVLTHPLDVSTQGNNNSEMGLNPGVGPPPEDGQPGELPPWLKDLFDDRLTSLPKPTESLPPTAAGTINLSDFNRTPANYANKTVQVNVLTSASLTERLDGYELDTNSGSGRPPANLRIIVPNDLAYQLHDLGLEPSDSYAARLIGLVEGPKALGEVRHTLRVNELQLLDPQSGQPALTFRPETRAPSTLPTLANLNRFPDQFVGQTLTLSLVFRGVTTIRQQPEIDFANGQNVKPLNLEFYTSKALAEQLQDEPFRGSQLARVVFKVERVNAKSGKGIIGVSKIELLNVRDGRPMKQLSSNEAIVYPMESRVVRGPVEIPNRPIGAGKAPSTSRTPVAPAAAEPKAGALTLWIILGGAFVFSVGLVVFAVGLYFLVFRNRSTTKAPTTKPTKATKSPVARDDSPDEFPGFG